MPHDGDCFLVPGPVRMSDGCLQAMATPVITARGAEFREVMAKLNSGLRYAFDLSPSPSEMKSQSWTGEDGYKVVVVSGSGTAAMEMVMPTDSEATISCWFQPTVSSESGWLIFAVSSAT